MSKSGRNTPFSERSSGFTLIEVALVIGLLALMSTLVATRFGVIDSWRQKAALRRFVNTWEMLHAQARARGESYRLLIDVERSVYSVRREVPAEGTQAKQVDYLKNWRSDSELEHRSQEEQNKLQSLEDEYKEEDAREGDALEKIFYGRVFRDPDANVRLGIPLEFPSLTNDQPLSGGLRFRDVSVSGGDSKGGPAEIRFSAAGASEFAVVHFTANGQVMTAVSNPATGKVSVLPGDVKYDWALGRQS